MTEVGVGYVQLLPSMRGFAGAVSSQLKGELDSATSKVGKSAGGSFMSGFGTGVQNVGRATSGLGDKMTIGLTAPLIAAGNQAVNYARDTAENLSKVQTVFGAASGKIERFSQTSADSFGISRRAALEYAGSFGNMFDQIGFTSDAAADMSLSMTKLSADFASFHNLNIEDVLNAQSAAFRGEYDSLQRVIPTINAAAVEQKALAMTGKESAKELTAQEKALATYEFMIENAGVAAGDFARTSESLANVERRTAAAAEDSAAAFGDKLMPIKQQLVEVVGQLLDKFNNLTPAQQDMIVKAGLMAAALGPVLSVFGRVITGIGGVVRGVGALGRGVISVAKFGGKAAMGIGRMAASFGRLALSAGKAALQVGRAALQMAVSAAKATARVVAQIAIQIARWVVLGVQALIHAAKVALAWLISLGPIALVIAAVIAAVALIIANWDKVSKFIVAAATWMWQRVVDIFTTLKDWIWAWITGVVGFYLKLPTMIAGAIIAIYNLFVTWLTKAAAWVWGKLGEIVGYFLGLGGRVVGGIVAVYNLVAEWFGKAKDWVGQKIDQIVDYFSNLPGRILGSLAKAKQYISDKFTEAKEIVTSLLDGLIGAFKAIPGRVSSAISSVTEKFKKPFIDAFDAIRSFWNRTVGGFGISIPSWVPRIGGRSFRIPKMHSGGIFQAETGNEGLALLRSGERVLTESDQRQMNRYGSGSAAAQVEIVFSGRNNDLLMRWLRQQVRVNGGSVQGAFS